MDEKNTGGPAFPGATGIDVYENGQYPAGFMPGMTLRDWFAGQALIGLVTAGHDMSIGDFAEEAYLYADAMLKRRGRSASND